MRTITSDTLSSDFIADRPSGIERMMVAIVFVFSSGIFDPRIVPVLTFLKVNDLFVAFAAGFGVFLAFTKYRGELKLFDHRSLAIFFAFYIFVGMAIFWSHSPHTATPRYIGFTLVTLWTLYIALRFNVRELLLILLVTLLVIASVSLVVSFAFPGLGQMPEYFHKGDWKGIYIHKNSLGRVMAVLVLVSLFCLLFTGPRKLGFVGLVLSLPILYFSGSRTAYALAGIMLVSILLLYLRRRPWLIVVILVGTIFLSLVLTLQTVLEGNPLLEVEGETLTFLQMGYSFTGRFGIWQFAINGIIEKPWFGYGYDGFWKVREFGGQLVQEEGGKQFLQAHNGYLDTTLEVGLVGLAMFFVVYFIFLGRGVRRVTFAKVDPGDLFATLYVFIFFTTNITESYLLRATTINQLLFTYSLVLLCKPFRLSETDYEDSDYDVSESYVMKEEESHHHEKFRSRNGDSGGRKTRRR